MASAFLLLSGMMGEWSPLKKEKKPRDLSVTIIAVYILIINIFKISEWFLWKVWFINEWSTECTKRERRIVQDAQSCRSKKNKVHWVYGGPAPCYRNEIWASKLGYKCNPLYHYFWLLFKSWDKKHESFLLLSHATWFC